MTTRLRPLSDDADVDVRIVMRVRWLDRGPRPRVRSQDGCRLIGGELSVSIPVSSPEVAQTAARSMARELRQAGIVSRAAFGGRP